MTTSTTILITLGLAILFGTMGARFFQKRNIPQVVGFITVGIIIGRSGFNFIDEHILELLKDINQLALGIIGFVIGGSLNLKELRGQSRELLWLLLSQGLGAFFFTTVASFSVIYCCWEVGLEYSLAVSILLGGIAVATAPAATVEVLREYKAKGKLTSTLMAMISLDDVFCLILFSIMAAVARTIYVPAGAIGSQSSALLLHQLAEATLEISASSLLGLVLAIVLKRLIRSIRDSEKTLDYTMGIILLLVAASVWLKLNVMLASMVLGLMLVNLAPNRSRGAFEAVNRFSPPIYALFFVFGGARLVFGDLNSVGWMLVIIYVASRAAGKILGVFLGARIASSSVVIKKYLGLGMLDQAGVAIGLAIVSQQYLDPETGSILLAVVTAAIFINQLLAPSLIKYAITKAGEVGRGFCEQDLVQGAKVSDFMLSFDYPPLTESSNVHDILEAFSRTPAIALPVVDADGFPIGMIDAEQVKEAWQAYDCDSPVIAEDIFHSLEVAVTPDDPLEEALTKIDEYNQDAVPVIASRENPTLIGILDSRVVHHTILEKLVQGEVPQFVPPHCRNKNSEDIESR